MYHHIQHFKSIHNRHYDIKQHQGNPHAVLLQDIQTFFSVFCLQNIKILFQHL